MTQPTDPSRQEGASQTPSPSPLDAPPPGWQIIPRFDWRFFAMLFVIALLMAWSGKRTDIDRAVSMTTEGAAHAVGLIDDSEIGTGWMRFVDSAFPMVFAERTAVERVEGFDRDNLPWLAYLETEPVREYDIEAQQMKVTGQQEFLVQPGGYLLRVLALMAQTIEIGFWGTVLAVSLALPIGCLGARNFAAHPTIYHFARTLCSLSRAIPELILAMFFVLVYEFGAIPGVLALGLHSFGFLGKFFADDMENADPGPQEALISTGANRLQVIRMAVWPQVLPQYIAYVQYILERNVRSATVLGVVGAGGIGMELKGRWDMSNFGHVATILLIIFITVFILERVTQWFRGKLIQSS